MGKTHLKDDENCYDPKKKTFSIKVVVYFAIAFLTAGALCQQSENPFKYHTQTRPHVLVDQTHDYLFVVYHLAYFLNEKGMLGAHSDRSITWDLIRNCDVVVTHQGNNDVPYTSEEIETLKQFVKRGGGLLLIGNNAIHAQKITRRKNEGLPVRYNDLPMNRLAADFGLRFSETPARQPFVIPANPFAPELTGEVIAFQDSVSYGLRPFCQIERLSDSPIDIFLRDASGPRGQEQGVPNKGEGAAILAAVSFGQGRVAALGGTDFIATMDAPTKELFFERLFLWMGENSPKRIEMAGKEWGEIFPDIEFHTGYDYELRKKPWLADRYRGRAPFIWPEHRDVIAGVTVLYNDATAAEARRIMQKVFPRVQKALTEIYGRGPREQKADPRIHFFSNAGSGYSWDRLHVVEPLVGLPGLSDSEQIPAYKVSIVQHELTHAWGLPLGLSGHLLMNFNNSDLAEKLPEMRDWQEKRWVQQLARLQKVDPDLKQMDMAVLPDFKGSPKDRLRWIKWTWAFRKLRKKYGSGYFARVIKLADKKGAGTEEDVHTLIYYLCLASKENLYPWFEKHGTTVKKRPLPESFQVARIEEN